MFETQAASEFGELLREYRRTAGLTQEQLAERSGLSARSISEMERGGEHVPRRDTVSLLVRGLSLSASERGAFEELITRQRRPRRAVRAPVLSITRSDQARHNLPRPLTTFV